MAHDQNKANAGDKILPCLCGSTFQDERYGGGNRVHTVGGTKDNQRYTCTVCGRVKGEDATRRAKPKKEDSK